MFVREGSAASEPPPRALLRPPPPNPRAGRDKHAYRVRMGRSIAAVPPDKEIAFSVFLAAVEQSSRGGLSKRVVRYTVKVARIYIYIYIYIYMNIYIYV